MNAVEEALGYYAVNGVADQTMGDDVMVHAMTPGGVVLVSPRCVFMARPVDSRARVEEVVLPHVRFAPEVWDAMFVHLLVGEAAYAADVLGELAALPLICFQRGTRSPRLRVYGMRDFLRRLKIINK